MIHPRARPQSEYRDPMLLPVPVDRDVIVVIDRKEARLYDLWMSGGLPQRVTRCAPPEGGPRVRFRLAPPMGGMRGLLHGGLRGTLRSARMILIVGHGPDAAEVVADLLAELRQGDGELSRRVRVAISPASSHLTESRLLELARSALGSDPADS